MPQFYTLSTRTGKYILIGTILASAMAFLDSTIVNIAIPTIQTKLSANLSGIQWVVNGYTLIMASFILLSGALGDRYGRRRIFLTGIALFTLSSFFCSLSNTIQILIVSRFIQGTGASLMIPGSLSIINSSFAQSQRGQVIGLWSGFTAGVSALGPLLGGYLVQTFGWQSIFYINLPIGLIAYLITLRFVPAQKIHHVTSLDILGTILLFLCLFGISYGLIQGPLNGFSAPPILFSLIFGLLCGIIFVFVEKHINNPIIPFAIFKNPLVLGANLATLFLYFSLSGLIFFYVLNLQQIQGYTPILAGLSLLVPIFLITFLSAPAGSLSDRIGPRLQMIVGPMLVGLGMVLLSQTKMADNYFFSYLPGLCLFGLGMSLVIAPLTKSALSVDEHLSGVASGINNAVSRIAGLLAVSILGLLIAGIFSSQLQTGVTQSEMTPPLKQMIITQSDKLGAIQMPMQFTNRERQDTKGIITNAFLDGFRIIMEICAFLAFLSSGVSFIFIKPQQKHR